MRGARRCGTVAPVPRHDGTRDLWNNEEIRVQRTFEPGRSLAVPQARRSGDASPLRTLLVLAAVAAALWFGWKFAQPWIARLRASGDVERCATDVLRGLPAVAASERDLLDEAGRLVNEMAGAKASRDARWYVCAGPRGDTIRVLRDDSFSPTERAFAERIVDEGRLRTEVQGTRHDVFLYPLGASWSSVKVDGIPWCVVVAWSEGAAPAPTAAATPR